MFHQNFASVFELLLLVESKKNPQARNIVSHKLFLLVSCVATACDYLAADLTLVKNTDHGQRKQSPILVYKFCI